MINGVLSTLQVMHAGYLSYRHHRADGRAQVGECAELGSLERWRLRRRISELKIPCINKGLDRLDHILLADFPKIP